MKLGAKQELFSTLLPTLYDFIHQQEYCNIRSGELYRPPEMAAIYAARGTGIKNSLHTKKLAIDLNLMLGNEYLDGSARSHLEIYGRIGEFWKNLHPLACWGGDFRGGVGRDLGHFSITHGGVK